MKNQNTYECLPVCSSIATDHAASSGDGAKVGCAKSSSDLSEANFTTSNEVRGGVKATPISNCVFVLSKNKEPLTPCTPARARQMLKQGKAAVFRRFPFTLILKREASSEIVQPLELRIDPGAKTTGLVLVHKKQNRVLWAGELNHRGEQIRSSLQSRRSLRRSRRSRKTRYRKPRFLNRKKKEKWLAPSLEHRVVSTMTWVNRFLRFCPIDSLTAERVRFDTQKLNNPEISGVEYQQGELQGYEVFEYLLEKWQRKCAYCQAQDVPLEKDHVHPRSRGGSDRVSNLTLACRKCNQKKGARTLHEFLKDDPILLQKIESQLKQPLDGAAAVNSTRNKILEQLQETGLEVHTGTGGQTKFNRAQMNYPKAHWIDAACVGEPGHQVKLNPQMSILSMESTGHGTRQMCGTDQFGFPIRHRTRKKVHFGFRSGDQVEAKVPKGKKAGNYQGRVLARATGSFDIVTSRGRVQGISHRYCRPIHASDGYHYKISSLNGDSCKSVLA